MKIVEHQFETTPPENNGSQMSYTSYAGWWIRVYNAPLSDNEVSLVLLEKDNR
jgi:hypothetical protein